MGLDISISVNNYEEVHENYHDSKIDYFNLHSLSRTFCNFMCRRDVVEHEAELDQIGRITGVDISTIYEMNQYPSEEYIEMQLEYMDEAEKQEFLNMIAESKARLSGNIEKVYSVVDILISKLSSIVHLPELLIKTDFDSLNNASYFSAFNVDAGKGYIGNNFGQDLRNFRRYLEFCKKRGSTTVWFDYH